MNKCLYFAIGFVAGLVVGHILDARKEEPTDIPEETEEMTDEELDARENEIMDEVVNIINKHGYAKMMTKEEFNAIKPYQISQDDFAEFDNYEALSLTYFADGILTDEEYEVIKNPKELLGDFEQYLDKADVVYIRCDERCADYEIAKDIRTYAEVYNTLPHMKWRSDE